jgi:two-component system, cell cycle response regulator
MTARILVVDDLLPNLKLLEVRLTAEYFDVVTAMNGPDALAIAARGECELVLLDVMMPGMDGFEVCRRLKSDVATAHLPVILVTALDQPADRLKGLEAGADDFVTKPINEVALLARVKSLLRLKLLTDELRTRAQATRDLGFDDPTTAALRDKGEKGRVLIVDDRPTSFQRLAESLCQQQEVFVQSDPHQALVHIPDGNFDVVIVSLGLTNFDGLRLCSQLRSLERTRKLPILIIADMDDSARVLRGLEIGVNDYLMRPVDRNEMMARVRTQVRRKRYTDRLASAVSRSLEAAVVDSLTGLHNRRFMQTHLSALVSESVTQERNLTVLVLDIDHFKRVNDTWGHEAGDEVLKEFASRMRKVVRGVDIVCRTGGEEFVVIMPETEPASAFRVAERIRQSVERDPFIVEGGKTAIPITTSIGMAGFERGHTTVDAMLKKADEALYRAKRDGRNRIVACAA